jgi:hypothetical protein
MMGSGSGSRIRKLGSFSGIKADLSQHVFRIFSVRRTAISGGW